MLGKRMFGVGFEPWGDPPPSGMPVFVDLGEFAWLWGSSRSPLWGTSSRFMVPQPNSWLAVLLQSKTG